jgi:hypothetical protein
MKYKIYLGLKPNGEWKIGVDCNFPNRPYRQKLSNVSILEEHDDISIASQREIDLQLEHFGKRDNFVTYETSIKSMELRRSRLSNDLLKAAQSKGGLATRKLTLKQAQDIRNEYTTTKITHRELAAKYNVSTYVTKCIVKGETYQI